MKNQNYPYFATIVTLVTVLFISGCFREPEGPAERIGKSIDKITTEVQNISKDIEPKDGQVPVQEEEQVRVIREKKRDDSWKTRPYSEY
jgi:hypothetical protein